MGKLIELSQYKEKQFTIANKTETEAEIVIYDQIGESFWEDGITAKSFSEELKNLPKTITQINVRINSPGGDVFDGITIYERLKTHPANITVYVDGLAASIASVIAMAGDEIIIGDGGMLMIHKPMAGVYGNVLQMERMMNLLDKVEDRIINIYKKKTKMSDTELMKLIEGSDGEGTWLDGEEAKSLGFVDTIQDESNLQIAASLINKSKWIKNAPKLQATKKNDEIRGKLQGFKKDVEGFLAR